MLPSSQQVSRRAVQQRRTTVCKRGQQDSKNRSAWEELSLEKRGKQDAFTTQPRLGKRLGTLETDRLRTVSHGIDEEREIANWDGNGYRFRYEPPQAVCVRLLCPKSPTNFWATINDMFTMSSVIEQAEAFREYVVRQCQGGHTNSSLEELFQNWRATFSTATELKQSLQSLSCGLADAQAGRLIDADQAIDETRTRLQRMV